MIKKLALPPHVLLTLRDGKWKLTLSLNLFFISFLNFQGWFQKLYVQHWEDICPFSFIGHKSQRGCSFSIYVESYVQIALLSYQSETAKGILDTILNIQPKDSSSGGGETRESMVYKFCDDVLKRLPSDYDPFEKKACLAKLGIMEPLVIFLRQVWQEEVYCLTNGLNEQLFLWYPLNNDMWRNVSCVTRPYFVAL